MLFVTSDVHFSSCQGRFSLMILSWIIDWSSCGLPRPHRFHGVDSLQGAFEEVLLSRNAPVEYTYFCLGSVWVVYG